MVPDGTHFPRRARPTPAGSWTPVWALVARVVVVPTFCSQPLAHRSALTGERAPRLGVQETVVKTLGADGKRGDSRWWLHWVLTPTVRDLELAPTFSLNSETKGLSEMFLFYHLLLKSA